MANGRDELTPAVPGGARARRRRARRCARRAGAGGTDGAWSRSTCTCSRRPRWRSALCGAAGACRWRTSTSPPRSRSGQMERLRGHLVVRLGSRPPCHRHVRRGRRARDRSADARRLPPHRRLGGRLPRGEHARRPTSSTSSARRHPDLVALSVTQPEHLPAVERRRDGPSRCRPVPKVLAGGAALRGRPRAAATLGVDGVAADALSGMHEARRLIAEPPPVGATSEDYFERLGRCVQELRSGKGWTQQQLARSCRPGSHLYQWSRARQAESDARRVAASDPSARGAAGSARRPRCRQRRWARATLSPPRYRVATSPKPKVSAAGSSARGGRGDRQSARHGRERA